MNKTVFITGASGSGKTTLVKYLESQDDSRTYCYFDSIGVPSDEEMQKVYGSAETWQRLTTEKWVERIKNDLLPSRDVVLDGQMRITFIEQACREKGLKPYSIILVDCSDAIRKERLVARGHANLADDNMMDWARYLRNEARTNGCTILDTTNKNIEESAKELRALTG